MPVTWTADNDRRLLLLVLELTKVNNNDVAKRWGEKYVDEPGDRPTERAITERLYKLKGAVRSGKPNTTPSKASTKGPRTPVKPNGKGITKPRTPASSSKKRRLHFSDSDEEPSMSSNKTESDNEQKYVDPDPTPRRHLPGRNRKLAQSYAEQSDDTEAEPATGESVSGQFLNGSVKNNGFDEEDMSNGSDLEFV